MKIDVLMFAAAKEVAGRDKVSIEVSEPACAADVLGALAKELPGLTGLLPSSRLAVDCQYVDGEAEISPDSEVAFIPPVSGG